MAVDTTHVASRHVGAPPSLPKSSLAHLPTWRSNATAGSRELRASHTDSAVPCTRAAASGCHAPDPRAGDQRAPDTPTVRAPSDPRMHDRDRDAPDARWSPGTTI